MNTAIRRPRMQRWRRFVRLFLQQAKRLQEGDAHSRLLRGQVLGIAQHARLLDADIRALARRLKLLLQETAL